MPGQSDYPGVSLHVDLTGCRSFPEAESVQLFGAWIGWAPDEIRQRCAEHYGIDVEQVGEPVSMMRSEFDRQERCS
jgi:hypothetical protein